ncbi:MAG: serine/threonine protein kinase [Actinobacteria bacterium]|nr:serine/threonine protein kinase [Actinomycetota bacterium]
MRDALAADALLGNRYRLLRPLARGGMAAVWEAEDSVLGRRVAVKVLHPHLAVDASVRERFRREAVAVARLSHPAVVAVFDTGEDDDVAYLVMELVEGPTLRDVLREQGALPTATAVEIVAQVAAGLGVAHERGIVHRDVKPANILVLPDSRAKLTDFGIARGEQGTDFDEDLTSTGTIVGTARYLAPEQVHGGAVDARTDVYALGLVLYEAVCGRPAFDEETEIATAIARTQGGPLPPRQVRVDVPRELEAVIMRSLARDPADRFQTAADLRSALLALHATLDDTPAAGIRLPAPADRRFTAGAIAIIVVALVVALVGLFATETGRSVLKGFRDRLPGGDAAPARITGTADFDPFGDDRQENPETAPLARDGSRDTAWETTRYNTPAFGNLKPGVGLRIDLAAESALSELTVIAQGAPWDAEVYVGDAAAATLDAWGEPVARGTGLGERATFDLHGTAGRSVLLWITHLPASGQLGIAEVRVAG